MTYFNNILRGSLVMFGVALGLIGTAGGASAQDAAPASDDSAHVTVAPEEEATLGLSSAQDEDAEIGDGLFIERPAPRPDPGNELRSDPAPTPAPAPAPAAPAASGSASSPAATSVTAAEAPATPAPVRATEVRGVQLERSATVTSSDPGVDLARTGLDTADLSVLAGALLALGALLIRATQPRRTS